MARKTESRPDPQKPPVAYVDPRGQLVELKAVVGAFLKKMAEVQEKLYGAVQLDIAHGLGHDFRKKAEPQTGSVVAGLFVDCLVDIGWSRGKPVLPEEIADAGVYYLGFGPVFSHIRSAPTTDSAIQVQFHTSKGLIAPFSVRYDDAIITPAEVTRLNQAGQWLNKHLTKKYGNASPFQVRVQNAADALLQLGFTITPPKGFANIAEAIDELAKQWDAEGDDKAPFAGSPESISGLLQNGWEGMRHTLKQLGFGTRKPRGDVGALPQKNRVYVVGLETENRKAQVVVGVHPSSLVSGSVLGRYQGLTVAPRPINAENPKEAAARYRALVGLTKNLPVEERLESPIKPPQRTASIPHQEPEDTEEEQEPLPPEPTVESDTDSDDDEGVPEITFTLPVPKDPEDPETSMPAISGSSIPNLEEVHPVWVLLAAMYPDYDSFRNPNLPSPGRHIYQAATTGNATLRGQGRPTQDYDLVVMEIDEIDWASDQFEEDVEATELLTKAALGAQKLLNIGVDHPHFEKRARRMVKAIPRRVMVPLALDEEDTSLSGEVGDAIIQAYMDNGWEHILVLVPTGRGMGEVNNLRAFYEDLRREIYDDTYDDEESPEGKESEDSPWDYYLTEMLDLGKPEIRAVANGLGISVEEMRQQSPEDIFRIQGDTFVPLLVRVSGQPEAEILRLFENPPAPTVAAGPSLVRMRGGRPIHKPQVTAGPEYDEEIEAPTCPKKGCGGGTLQGTRDSEDLWECPVCHWKWRTPTKERQVSGGEPAGPEGPEPTGDVYVQETQDGYEAAYGGHFAANSPEWDDLIDQLRVWVRNTPFPDGVPKIMYLDSDQSAYEINLSTGQISSTPQAVGMSPPPLPDGMEEDGKIEIIETTSRERRFQALFTGGDLKEHIVGFAKTYDDILDVIDGWLDMNTSSIPVFLKGREIDIATGKPVKGDDTVSGPVAYTTEIGENDITVQAIDGLYVAYYQGAEILSVEGRRNLVRAIREWLEKKGLTESRAWMVDPSLMKIRSLQVWPEC